MARKVAPKHQRTRAKSPPPIHVVIPDCQVRPGVSTRHIEWIARYVKEKYAGRANVRIIVLGDFWDMPSLSSYDRKGGTLSEGRRYTADVQAGNAAWEILDSYLSGQGFDLHFLFGNHEERIVRAAEQDAVLEGALSLDHLAVNAEGSEWQAHPFLEVVTLDGVLYSHYFANRMTGRAISGQSMDLRIKTIGRSFTMGHQQGLWFGRREIADGTAHLGLVVGSCYLHDEQYLGRQGNAHWRGIVVCYDVRNGDYDPKMVSLTSLAHRYTGRYLRPRKAGA